MMLTIQVRFLSCIIVSACHGFLLTNKTGISSVGTQGLTDGHYLILTDALSIQKQLLLQMETFVLKLQNQLKTVNQEVKDIKSGKCATQLHVVAKLRNETSELREKSARLQNSYDILQKKFNTIQSENNVLKTDNDALKIQITDWHNSSMQTKHELDFFKHTILNVTSIQSNVDSLTSQMKTVNSRIYSLTSTSNSRSQDILDLFNETNTADLKFEAMDSWSKSFQNYTLNRIQSLEQNFAVLLNVTNSVKGKVQEMNETVAITSCGKGTATYFGGEIMKFPCTKTSVGINNVSEFQNTGQLTCEKSGLYIFVVYVSRYSSNGAAFSLWRNSQTISNVMIDFGASYGTSYSGSGTVVVKINSGDILYARTNLNMMTHGDHSCFTVIKIN